LALKNNKPLTAVLVARGVSLRGGTASLAATSADEFPKKIRGEYQV
jgi:hypothetical protein